MHFANEMNKRTALMIPSRARILLQSWGLKGLQPFNGSSAL
jgi:hypothetical protein